MDSPMPVEPPNDATDFNPNELEEQNDGQQ